jgi:hypothetical protein
MHVLWGWCTIHAVIYLGLAYAAFWIGQFLWQLTTEPKPEPRLKPAVPQRVPHWARTGHLSSSSSRPQGRHRKTGSTR